MISRGLDGGRGGRGRERPGQREKGSTHVACGGAVRQGLCVSLEAGKGEDATVPWNLQGELAPAAPRSEPRVAPVGLLTSRPEDGELVLL